MEPKLRSPSMSAWQFAAQVIAPAFAAVAVVATLLIVFVLFSAKQADGLAWQRERRIMSTVLAQSVGQVAHDQEGSTVWDEAVRQVHAAKLDQRWLDDNVGVWLHTYSMHDEIYVLDDKNLPIYAMRDARHVDASTNYRSISSTVEQLANSLRHKLRNPRPGDVGASSLTPAAIDLCTIHGHPAIISVKAFTSDTGRVRQVPGTEYLHVAVRYLDTGFMRKLASEYRLDHVRYSTTRWILGQERAMPLRSSSKRLLGYFVWRSFQPGSLMVRRIAPLMGLSLLLVFVVVTVLLRYLRQGAVQLEASEQQAQYLAFHDPLTGVANRAMFNERLAHELAQASAGATSLALLYLDLDGFKHVNDTLGHPAGDQLIREVAGRLGSTVRSTDLVARLGGDEFAIIQIGINSRAAAEILCVRIIEEINTPFQIAGTQARVGMSIGIAVHSNDVTEEIELIRQADIALYEAKSAGKGRHIFFSQEMDSGVRRRDQIETDLRAALEVEDQLEVYYQPIHAARGGAITGVEALIRWRHPDHGTISPAIFIPVAEQTGLIDRLGEWVLEQSCKTAMRWPIDSISVNVSPVQLGSLQFPDHVFATLERTGLDPTRLELEITETSFIKNAAGCRHTLSILRKRGIKVALDDFGTGYSSFTHLRNFDVDRIKIDQSFVQGISSPEFGSPIVQAIVDLAKAFELAVTAEGVETTEQRSFLARIGCTSLQGFLLGRPMPADALDKIFDSAAVFRPATLNPGGVMGAQL